MANKKTSPEGVDLFEDYENIPKNVQKVLDKHQSAFEDGDYAGLEKANTELKKIGYTFEYYVDGQAYDLRKIGQKGKLEEGKMAKGGLVLSNNEIIKDIDFEDNTDTRHGRYDFSFSTQDSEGAEMLDYDGYIIESPSSSRMNDEIEWGQNVPEDWETAEKILLAAFYKWKQNKMAKGGAVGDLKEDDYVWNAVGKKLVVDKVTKDEYYLSAFGQPSASPFSKSKVNNYIKTGQWSLKPKMANGGSIKSLLEEYQENEDNNFHTENALLLAKNFGTKNDVAVAKKAMAELDKKGYTLEGDKISEIHKRLYPALKNAAPPKGKMEKGGAVEKLYYVVGKKKGQLVDVSELPMTKEDAERFIKEQGIEKHYDFNTVDIIPYHGNKPRFKYEQGGNITGPSEFCYTIGGL